MRIAVVGGGFSGAVIANRLGRAGHKISLFESQAHLGGHCHTERDPETGIMIHKYGPHIFHTNNERVWGFVNRFDKFMPYINRVKAIARGRVYSLPINLLTINQFFNRTLGPAEARTFIENLADSSIEHPASFEDQALRYMGKDLYEAFFKGYTLKQWGVHPRDLPASILKRLPIRFNYDDNYYNHKYQGVPRNGYTALIERMLDISNIALYLNTTFERRQTKDFDYTFYSGPLDSWFEHIFGRLPYRTLDFEVFRGIDDYQGVAVVNYCDSLTPFTRITEHKHFAPWETHEKTICYKEFSRQCNENDTPYYPIRIDRNIPLLQRYVNLALVEKQVAFTGRLGTYRYLDMDVTIKESLELSERFLANPSMKTKLSDFGLD